MIFDFEPQEVNYILSVLSERQYRESAGMIAKIQSQAQAQQQEQVEAGLPANFSK